MATLSNSQRGKGKEDSPRLKTRRWTEKEIEYEKEILRSQTLKRRFPHAQRCMTAHKEGG